MFGWARVRGTRTLFQSGIARQRSFGAQMLVLGRSHVEATVKRAQIDYLDVAMLRYLGAEAYQRDA